MNTNLLSGRSGGPSALLAVILLPAAIAFGATFESGAIAVEDPWSRATPDGAKVAAGFLTIKNEGEAADRLLSVASPIAARAEIHETKMENGMMKMRPVTDGIAIAPGDLVALAPNGYHVMFTGLTAPLKEGEQFTGTLTFEQAGAIEVTFDVKAIGASGGAEGHHHH